MYCAFVCIRVRIRVPVECSERSSFCISAARRSCSESCMRVWPRRGRDRGLRWARSQRAPARRRRAPPRASRGASRTPSGGTTPSACLFPSRARTADTRSCRSSAACSARDRLGAARRSLLIIATPAARLVRPTRSEVSSAQSTPSTQYADTTQEMARAFDLTSHNSQEEVKAQLKAQ